jgi:hypothetical protein
MVSRGVVLLLIACQALYSGLLSCSHSHGGFGQDAHGREYVPHVHVSDLPFWPCPDPRHGRDEDHDDAVYLPGAAFVKDSTRPDDASPRESTFAPLFHFSDLSHPDSALAPAGPPAPAPAFPHAPAVFLRTLRIRI